MNPTEQLVKPKDPKEVERMIVNSIVKNQSFFTCLYWLHEKFQSGDLDNKKEKIRLKTSILSQISGKVDNKKYFEVETLLNNFLRLS
jgi:hypothetical protein